MTDLWQPIVQTIVIVGTLAFAVCVVAFALARAARDERKTEPQVADGWTVTITAEESRRLYEIETVAANYVECRLALRNQFGADRYRLAEDVEDRFEALVAAVRQQ